MEQTPTQNLSLTDLAQGAHKPDRYLSRYQDHFDAIRSKEICLLELGIYKGKSLLMWRDYFDRGTIAGLDYNAVELDDPTGRIHIYQGMQQDQSMLDQIAHECAPHGFNIIIDDASHIGELTQFSFWYLFENHLKPGGIYVIEDWMIAYWGGWVDGNQYEPPHRGENKQIDHFDTDALIVNKESYRGQRQFPSHDYGNVGFVKQLVDELAMEAITTRDPNGEPRLPRIAKMAFYPGQVFLQKNPAAY